MATSGPPLGHGHEARSNQDHSAYGTVYFFLRRVSLSNPLLAQFRMTEATQRLQVPPPQGANSDLLLRIRMK